MPMQTGRAKVGALSNAEVLSETMAWPSYQAAGVLTKEQLEHIYAIDKQPIDVQVSRFEAAGISYVELLSAIVSSVSKEEVTLYVLAMMDEILSAKPHVAHHFHAALFESKGASDPIAPLMKLLTRNSLFLLEKATVLIAKILSYAHYIPIAPEAAAEEVLARHLTAFTEWLLLVIKSINPSEGAESPKVTYALAGLQLLVSAAPGRQAVLVADGLPALVALMAGASYASHASVQLLYQVIFVLWSMSYSSEAAHVMVTSKLGLVVKLVDVVKFVQKEKVVRVAIACLKNLLGTASASGDMVGAGMVKVLDNLQHRKWADEDIVSDINVLNDALQEDLMSMSSWEVYSKELASGKLDWTPSHKSDNFWKDNFRSFEAHDCAVLKQLVALLSAEDPQTLAVACSDLAEFVKVHPEGRRLAASLDAKKPAMALLKHPDPEVQKHALTAVQRLMVINWEFMSK